jgi:hypothetical protein
MGRGIVPAQFHGETHFNLLLMSNTVVIVIEMVDFIYVSDYFITLCLTVTILSLYICL